MKNPTPFSSPFSSLQMMDLIAEIDREIGKLSSAAYRKEQQVWAEPKQLKNMRKLFSRARNMKSDSVSDFSLVVNDAASSDSRISQLTSELYRAAKCNEA